MDAAIDLSSLERELCRIPEVTAARVVAGADGDIEEVHILSLPSKHAKQVVRDVQSVAMATFDIDLDRRVVSVVQLDAAATNSLARTTAADDNGEREAEPRSSNGHSVADEPPRIMVQAVSAIRSGVRCDARVVLTRGDQEVTGTAEGLVATNSVLRLVAHATIIALRQLEPAAARSDIESATVVSIGGRDVAIATVVIVVPPYEEICAGSAVVRAAGEFDAIARAILDATNRRLPQLR